MSINAINPALTKPVQNPVIKEKPQNKPEQPSIANKASIFADAFQQKIQSQQPKVDGITNKLNKLDIGA